MRSRQPWPSFKPSPRPMPPVNGSPAVPIIGQPFQMKGFVGVATIECQCEAKTIIMLSGGAVRCNACGRGYALQLKNVEAHVNLLPPQGEAPAVPVPAPTGEPA